MVFDKIKADIHVCSCVRAIYPAAAKSPKTRSMSGRGVPPGWRAVVNFWRSLNPSTWRQPRGTFKGTDHLGNNYFEIEPERSKTGKLIRYFKPPSYESWDRELPAEWNAWLRMRRSEPPTAEESMRNLQKIERLKVNYKGRAPNQPYMPEKNSKFPRYPEYEESAGTKYKP